MVYQEVIFYKKSKLSLQITDAIIILYSRYIIILENIFRTWQKNIHYVLVMISYNIIHIIIVEKLNFLESINTI